MLSPWCNGIPFLDGLLVLAHILVRTAQARQKMATNIVYVYSLSSMGIDIADPHEDNDLLK